MLLSLSILSHAGIAQAAQDKVAAPTICTFSRGMVLAESIVGQKGTARLQQLAGQVQALLASNRKSLATDMTAFNQEFALLSAAELQNRQQALRRRQRELQRKTTQLNARIRYTRAQVTQTINMQIDALVDEQYESHGCSMLLQRDAVLRGNPSNDLTADVIKALNSQLTTIEFDLLALPTQSTNSDHHK